MLNINFSESQAGVKGRKPGLSIHLTIRRWAATLRAVPPTSDLWPQGSARSAAREAGRREESKRYLAGLVEEAVALRGLL